MKTNVILEEEKLVNKIRYNKHPRRKNNDLIAGMFALYETGKSLEEVGRIYRKTRQSIYDVFQTRKYPLRNKKMEGMRIIDGVRYVPDKQGYFRGTIEGKRIYAHRLLWKKEKGEISSDFVLCFIDGDKSNIALENLKLVRKKDMAKTFNPTGRNQFSHKID